jgi:hypothetical protein
MKIGELGKKIGYNPNLIVTTIRPPKAVLTELLIAEFWLCLIVDWNIAPLSVPLDQLSFGSRTIQTIEP